MSAREPTNPPSSTAGQVTSSTYCFPRASAPGRSLRACRSLWESRSWFASPSLPLACSLCFFSRSFFLSFSFCLSLFFFFPFINIVIIYLLWFGGVVFWSPTTPRALGGLRGRWRQQPGPSRTPGGSGASRCWNGRPEPLGSALLGLARPGPAGLRWAGGGRGRTALRRRSECASHKGAGEGRAICGRRGPEPRKGGAPAPAIPPPSPPSRSALRPAPGAARPPPVTMAPPPRRAAGLGRAGPGRRGGGEGGSVRCLGWGGSGSECRCGRGQGSWGVSVRPLDPFLWTFGKVGVGRPLCPGSPLRLVWVALSAEPSSPAPAEWKLLPSVCGGTHRLWSMRVSQKTGNKLKVKRTREISPHLGSIPLMVMLRPGHTGWHQAQDEGERFEEMA